MFSILKHMLGKCLHPYHKNNHFSKHNFHHHRWNVFLNCIGIHYQQEYSDLLLHKICKYLHSNIINILYHIVYKFLHQDKSYFDRCIYLKQVEIMVYIRYIHLNLNKNYNQLNISYKYLFKGNILFNICKYYHS